MAPFYGWADPFQSEIAAKIVGNITQDRKSFITQSILNDILIK